MVAKLPKKLFRLKNYRGKHIFLKNRPTVLLLLLLKIWCFFPPTTARDPLLLPRLTSLWRGDWLWSMKEGCQPAAFLAGRALLPMGRHEMPRSRPPWISHGILHPQLRRRNRSLHGCQASRSEARCGAGLGSASKCAEAPALIPDRSEFLMQSLGLKSLFAFNRRKHFPCLVALPTAPCFLHVKQGDNVSIFGN